MLQNLANAAGEAQKAISMPKQHNLWEPWPFAARWQSFAVRPPVAYTASQTKLRQFLPILWRGLSLVINLCQNLLQNFITKRLFFCTLPKHYMKAN